MSHKVVAQQKALHSGQGVFSGGPYDPGVAEHGGQQLYPFTLPDRVVGKDHKTILNQSDGYMLAVRIGLAGSVAWGNRIPG